MTNLADGGGRRSDFLPNSKFELVQVVWMLWEAYVLYHETSVTSPEDNLSMFQGTPLQYVKPQRFEHIIRWGQLQANIATFFVVVSVFISGVAQRDSWPQNCMDHGKRSKYLASLAWGVLIYPGFFTALLFPVRAFAVDYAGVSEDLCVHYVEEVMAVVPMRMGVWHMERMGGPLEGFQVAAFCELHP